MKQEAYEIYKNSKVEWIGEIPQHWRLAKIKYLSLVKRGASPRPIDDPKFFDENGEYSWVRISDVSASEKYLESTTQKMSGVGSRLSVKLEPGEMFLSIAGTVGKPCITNIKCCIHDGFVYFPNLKKELREYLYYIFETGLPYKGLGKLGTQLNLNTQTVGNIIIPIPDNSEILKIVGFIKIKEAMINKLIHLKEKQIKTLEKYRQSLITETVTKGLNDEVKMKDSGVEWIGDIPEHWDIKKIKHFANHIGSGKTPKGGAEVYVNEGILFIRSQNVYNESFKFNDVSYITEKIDRELSNSRVKKNDILLNITGASIGRSIVYKLDVPANVNQHVCIIRLNDKKISPDFLHYLIINDYIQNQIMAYQNGTSREGLNFVQVANIIFAFPPNIEEQMEIVRFLQNKTDEIGKLVNKIKMQIGVLEKYRQSLIYEAVTGKIDIRNYKENDLEV